MIGSPFHHLTHQPKHLRRVLLVVLLALVAYLLLSDSAADEPLLAEYEISGLLPEGGGAHNERSRQAGRIDDPSVILP